MNPVCFPFEVIVSVSFPATQQARHLEKSVAEISNALIPEGDTLREPVNTLSTKVLPILPSLLSSLINHFSSEL